MYLNEFMGRALLHLVTGDDLRAYRLWLENHDLSSQSVAHILSDARCFLRWATDAGYLERSPFPRRLLPKIQERPPDRLTGAEVERLVSIPEPWAFVVRFGLGTGLRWGEMKRARPSHVQGDFLVVAHTKTGRLRRVPLTVALAVELRAHADPLLPERLGADWFGEKVRKLSGISRFHPHQLRHTFACQWIERGGSLPALQQVLGHASVVTTQRYARLSDAAVLAEARRVEAWRERL
jgi:integrase/recombinase XerD